MLPLRRNHAFASAVVLTALTLPAVSAQTRQHIELGSRLAVDADVFSGNIETDFHAQGKVVVTNPRTHDVLQADHVDVRLTHPTKPAEGGNRSPVQEAHATGHVQINSQPKPDQRMEATGAAGTYWPGTQKATLTGGVTVTMTSPQLAGPAVVTGSHADLDLAKRTAEVFRTEAEPVQVKLHPKGGATGGTAAAAGAGAAGPIELLADRVLMDNTANRITATGSPVLKDDQGTVRAGRIWFDLDPTAKDIKTVHAVDQVRIDSENPQQGSFHGTSNEAVVNRDANTAIMTGDVHGTLIQPDNPEPKKLQGNRLTYNFKTHEFELGSQGEAQATVSFKPKPKKPAPSPQGSRQ